MKPSGNYDDDCESKCKCKHWTGEENPVWEENNFGEKNFSEGEVYEFTQLSYLILYIYLTQGFIAQCKFSYIHCIVFMTSAQIMSSYSFNPFIGSVAGKKELVNGRRTAEWEHQNIIYWRICKNINSSFSPISKYLLTLFLNIETMDTSCCMLW